MSVKVRSLFWVGVLSIATFGIYQIYWTVKTKNEIKGLGADIPSAFLIVVPFAHLYFWYKYAEGFTEFIKKGANFLGYFLIALLPYLVIFTTDMISRICASHISIFSSKIDLVFLKSAVVGYFSTLEIGFLVILVFQMELNKFAKQNVLH